MRLHRVDRANARALHCPRGTKSSDSLRPLPKPIYPASSLPQNVPHKRRHRNRPVKVGRVPRIFQTILLNTTAKACHLLWYAPPCHRFVVMPMFQTECQGADCSSRQTYIWALLQLTGRQGGSTRGRAQIQEQCQSSLVFVSSSVSFLLVDYIPSGTPESSSAGCHLPGLFGSDV